MTTNSCFKYALCVEWTTEFPFNNKSCESPHITLEGIEWYLRFACNSSVYFLELKKVNSDSTLRKNIVATTAIKNASALDEEPVLIERRSIYNYNSSTMWSKTINEISNQIPNVLAVGKCTVVCLFNNTETHFDKTHISRQIDFASASRSPLSVDLQSLSLDFSTFLKDETFSDVKLICADRTISCHKSLLAARSEVFADMFRTRMEEMEDDKAVEGDSELQFDIKDVDPEVLELLLEYVYSGKKPDFVESTARSLYEAADKFAVHALKGTCSVWMVGNLTLLNCLDMLVLADKHSDKQFLEAVIDFSAEHLKQIKKESWIEFKNNNPKLAIEVYDKHFWAGLSAEN